jgi:hypothetical protein
MNYWTCEYCGHGTPDVAGISCITCGNSSAGGIDGDAEFTDDLIKRLQKMRQAYILSRLGGGPCNTHKKN